MPDERPETVLTKSRHWLARPLLAGGLVVLLGAALAFLATRRPESGEIHLATNPSAALVTIDGKTVGQTPLTVQLPARMHHVVIRKDGYKTIERDIFVDPSSPQVDYDFPLELALTETQQEDISERVEKLKRLAEEAFRRGDYVAPENDNALYYASKIQELAPDEPFLARLRERIRHALRQQAKTAPRRNHLS